MSIPQSKYVAITSQVANTTQAANKDLILRVFTTNPLFAANTVYEFTSSKDVTNFAGALTIEAKIAAEYFGWISKVATQAKKISFMRYSFEALAPYMYTTKTLTPLASFTEISDGSMVVNLGGTAFTVSNINLTGATSYLDIANAIQTAIRANTQGGELWTNATFTYNAANTSFILTGGATGEAEINYAIAAETGTDLSALLGLNATNAPILSNGTAAETVTDILNKTTDISTNFLTFGFTSASDAFNNLDSIGQFADEQNNQYRFCFDLSSANYMAGIETAAKYTGMTAHYNINYGIEGINPAWLMSAILPATTNYTKPNGVKNYMFQQFPQQAVSIGINDGTLYQTLDNLNINYNGQTQKTGSNIAFYQNGFNADGVDTAIFDNEAWLKDAIATDVINAFLALDFVSADKGGEAVVVGIIQNNADKALKNHVFANGTVLNETQKAFITQVFNDETKWLECQNNGYAFSVDITTENLNNATIHVANYTLVYLKNNVIRKVTGRNILV